MNMFNHKLIVDGVTFDNRSLEDAKQQKIQDLKEITTQRINETEQIDVVTQINAALGIYDAQKIEEIKIKIAFWRDKYLDAKARILLATSNEEVDQINL